MKRITIILIGLLLFASHGIAQFKKGSFMQNGFTIPYRISFPDNYDPAKKYPLIVFMHGAGERGTDNEKQLTHGDNFLLKNTQVNYPAIVIAPQCPEFSYWANVRSHTIDGVRTFGFGFSDEPTQPMSIVMELIKDWVTSGKVDTERVYVGGLSMGGMGTFELLWRMPEVFAAAFPICGGGSLDKLQLYSKDLGLWIFHGDADQVVPVDYSRQIYHALKEKGYNVNYTEYPGVGHNSWDNFFNESGFFDWLFSNKR